MALDGRLILEKTGLDRSPVAWIEGEESRKCVAFLEISNLEDRAKTWDDFSLKLIQENLKEICNVRQNPSTRRGWELEYLYAI